MKEETEYMRTAGKKSAADAPAPDIKVCGNTKLTGKDYGNPQPVEKPPGNTKPPGKKLGDTRMPAGFRYRETFMTGKTEHGRTDPFRLRHPSMDCGKRAKLFAPFDALKGFGEAINAVAEKSGEEG